MAVVTISDSNLRRQDFEGAVTGDTGIGAGPGASTFVELFYQGVQTWARRANSANAERGFFVTITTVDMTAAGDEVVLFKGQVANSGAISSIANGGGLRHRIGSGTTAYYEYIVADDGTQGDIDYPTKGGWVISPIDPNEAAWRDGEAGSPSLSGVTEMSVSGAVTATTVSENFIFDAIDIGPGLYLVGGDGGSTDGIFQDFIDDDEGEATAGRFGHVSTQEGILFVYGTLAVGQTAGGTSTVTEFTDAGRVVIFPGGRVGDGWNRLLIDVDTAVTTVALTSMVFQGRGRTDLTHQFSSAGQVDGTNNEIDITAHGYLTGDLVFYEDQGGTAIVGLTDLTEFFVRAVTADAIALYAVGSSAGRQNAYSDTSRIGLTAAFVGENHRLTRRPQTTPDLTVTGSGAAASFLATSCVFDRFDTLTLVAIGTLLNCSIINTGKVSLGGGTLNGNTFQDSVLDEGEPLVISSTLNFISNNVFVSEGRGHAVNITATGTYTYAANTHTGYGPARTQFDTETDVTGGATDTITLTSHPYTTGDFVRYNTEGGTETPFGVSENGSKFYLRDVDANTVACYDTADGAINDTDRRNLTASGGGSGETHSFYSLTAAIANSSGGLVTINVTAGGDTPTFLNTTGSSTVVNNNTQITLTGLVDPTEVRVFAAGTQTELAGQENVTTGTFIFSRPATEDVDIRIFSVEYDPADIIGFTIPSEDTTLPIQQIFDPNFDNPA
jgi:hypothetical protein